MRVAVVDGAAFFPISEVRAIEVDLTAKQMRQSLRPCSIAADGRVYCYSAEEQSRAEAILSAAKISYTVKPIKAIQEHLDKVKGVRFKTPEEVARYLAGEDIPESLLITRLQEKLVAVEQKAEAAVNAADMLAIEIESLKKERG